MMHRQWKRLIHIVETISSFTSNCFCWQGRRGYFRLSTVCFLCLHFPILWQYLMLFRVCTSWSVSSWTIAWKICSVNLGCMKGFDSCMLLLRLHIAQEVHNSHKESMLLQTMKARYKCTYRNRDFGLRKVSIPYFH